MYKVVSSPVKVQRVVAVLKIVLLRNGKYRYINNLPTIIIYTELEAFQWSSSVLQ